MFATKADIGHINQALAFAINTVIESNGAIPVFSNDAEYNCIIAKQLRAAAEQLTDPYVAEHDCIMIRTTEDESGYLGSDSYFQLAKDRCYNAFGLCYRELGRVPTLDEVLEQSRQKDGMPLDTLPADCVRDAYAEVTERWQQNEKMGYHNPDGSFNWYCGE